jgi:hypothetical protein
MTRRFSDMSSYSNVYRYNRALLKTTATSGRVHSNAGGMYTAIIRSEARRYI